MILYTTTEPVHLIPEVTCELDCKIIYMFVLPEVVHQPERGLLGLLP